MIIESRKRNALAQFAESLQSHGRYSFTKDSAVRTLKISDNAFRLSSLRLIRQNKILRVRNNFYIIVPPEYRSSGGPPPIDYIDDLMKFSKQPYYVGLLSAASQFGASHQAVQVFQVVTDKSLRQLKVGRGKIQFITKKNITDTPTIQKKTRTGMVQFSTPEATALDLLRYPRQSGHLSHVATVLVELSDEIDTLKLLKLAKLEAEISVVQRLGYLLDKFTKCEATSSLQKWLAAKKPKPTFLRPQKPSARFPLNKKWQVFVNERVEPDL